jgi:8-oxo-dGTP diphosphatase
MNHPRYCPKCGTLVVKYSNPLPTADVVIYDKTLGIVLVRRRNPPLGMALPGGFIEEGETAEHAAVREMKEETGLDVSLLGILGVYSHPMRDMRCHTLTTVFVGRAAHPEQLCAGDDAADAAFYPLHALPEPLCFDHARVLEHLKDWLAQRRPLLPCAEDPHQAFDDIPYTYPF